MTTAWLNRVCCLRSPVLPVVVLGLAAVLALPAQAAPPTANYTVRFDAGWTAQNHPQNFPPGAHFSPLVLATHDARVRFWRVGELATPGIESMAELGLVSPLDAEIEAAIRAGTADQLQIGPVVLPAGSTEILFTARQEYPLVTLVTMIAPSPDWFVGVADLSLLENGEWVEGRVFRLEAHDAGTDNGSSYLSADREAAPHQPVSRLTAGPVSSGARFLGTLTFTRTDAVRPAPLHLAGERFAISAVWEKPDGIQGSGTSVRMTPDSGYLWFFNPENVEMVVKVLDACSFSNNFWVFAAGLTNLGVDLRVEDTRTGAVKTYHNPMGQAFAPIQDTAAFPCP